MVIEIFEPPDPGFSHEFLVYDSKRTELQRIFKFVREPGEGGGLTLMAEYPGGRIDRHPVVGDVQSYTAQRAQVIAALDGKLKPKQP